MKFLWSIFLISLLWWSFSMAQETDTTKNQAQQQEQMKNSDQKETQEQEQEVATQQKKQQEEFIDVNGNGIDDRLEQKGTGKRKGQQQAKDRFIDVDGDGICDGKESAIGLKNIYRKRRGNPGSR